MSDVQKLSALKVDKSGVEFYSNAQPKCPHCGAEFDIDENEAHYLYDDNDRHTVDCPSCELEFQVRTHVRWTFSTDEQDDD